MLSVEIDRKDGSWNVRARDYPGVEGTDESVNRAFALMWCIWNDMGHVVSLRPCLPDQKESIVATSCLKALEAQVAELRKGEGEPLIDIIAEKARR